MITVLHEVDRIMYAVFGDGTPGSRATLLTMVSESASPIAKCVDRLTGFLSSWGPNGEDWQLVLAVSGAAVFDNGDTRSWAASYMLQILALVYDHFEARMMHPPYTLFKLPDPDLSMKKKGDRH